MGPFSGKSLIQHIYDSHYSGSHTAHRFYKSWKQLKRLIDERRYELLATKLHYQWAHSEVWRDSVCQLFRNMSGIEDQYERIGRTEGRIEAEDMRLEGYVEQSVIPWETASNGLAVQCLAKKCSAEITFNGQTATYDISIQYYDESDGISEFKLFVSSELISEWKADDSLPGTRPSGDTSTRMTAEAVLLSKSDTIRVEAIPSEKEKAVIDYIQIQLSS